MTKRDSSSAGIDFPRAPMSVPRRQFTLHFQHGSGAASSQGASSSANAMGPWSAEPAPPQGPEERGTNVGAHHFGYTTEITSVPLPHGYSSHPQGEAYPLQSEMSQQHRVLHTHIFKEVMSPPDRPNRLMATEVDRYGVERNRQPEFFFNGIVGHVRSYDGGRINSWDQATRLANYWRRFYNISEVQGEDTSWTPSWQNYQRSSDNADQTSEFHEEQPESDMEDDTSITANTGTVPIPSQIHQLATVLHNILIRQGIQCCDP